MSRIKAVYLDWNGTVIEDADDKLLFKGIAMDLVKAAALGFVYPFGESARLRQTHDKCRVKHLLFVKDELDSLYESGRKGEIPYEEMVREMYTLYNREIIRGLPLQVLRKEIDKYAEKAVSRLDKRVLDVIKQSRVVGGIGAVVLGPSSGSEPVIRAVLNRSEYNGGLFAEIIANRLEVSKDGRRAHGFSIDLFGSEEKRRQLEANLAFRGLHPREASYVGNDDRDDGCFELWLKMAELLL